MWTQSCRTYLLQGHGSGLLERGGSYVTLTNGSDFTIVVEKMSWAHSQWCGARWLDVSLMCCSIRPPLDEYDTGSENATFTLAGEWAQQTLRLFVWYTAFKWDGMTQLNSTFFEQLTPIDVAGGSFNLTIHPDELFTITTLGRGRKAFIPPPPPSMPFPAVYADDFERYNISSEAQYFADQTGSFEIAAGDSAHGRVMRQSVPALPIIYDSDFAPFSVIGDYKWSDTNVSAEVLIETSGAAFVGVRCGVCCYPGGVFFSISVDSQSWILSSNIDVDNVAMALASGEFAVQPGTWYNLTLSAVGATANAWIDGQAVLQGFELPSISVGWAAIGTSAHVNGSFTLAQFDNFAVAGVEAACLPPRAGDAVTLLWCGGLCMAMMCTVMMVALQRRMPATRSGM